MVEVQKFTFKVAGKPDFVIEAVTPGDAMGRANAHFGSLPQGVWMESPSWANTLGVYTWTLGNFFD